MIKLLLLVGLKSSLKKDLKSMKQFLIKQNALNKSF